MDVPNDSHASQVGLNRWVKLKGAACLFNHSCDPNCGINCKGIIRCYMAFKDIKAGEEITYDYAMPNYQVDHFPNCDCKAKNCRKKIVGYKGLSQEKKKEYEGFIAPYLLEIDEMKKKEEEKSG